MAGCDPAARIGRTAALIARRPDDSQPEDQPSSGAPCRPRHRSSSPRVTAAACCALGLSPDGLPACPVTAGAGRLLLSLSVIRARLRTVDRLIPLPPHRGQLLPRGPRFPLSVSLRLPRLGQLPFGLPGSEARLPPIGLGLLGAGPKLRPGLLGRRDLRLQPGLVRARRLAGLRHLLFRRPAHLVQLRPGRLSRLPRLPRIGLGLLGVSLKPSPGLLSRRDLLFRRPAHPVQLHLSRLSPGHPGLRARYRLVPLPPHRSQLLPRGPRLLLSGGLRLPRIGLGPLGAGLKPSPGLLSRRDLLFRRPAHPVQLHLSRLSPGHPGLRARYRLVPLPPHRSQLLPRGPRLLLSGGLRLPRPGQPRLSLRRRPPRPGQPRLGLRRHLPRLPRIGLSPLGAGLKPSPGLLSRRDLLFRRPAHPVQLRPSRLSRLPRPRRVLPGLAGPGLGPGRPGLRARYRLVPLPPHRSQLLPRGPRLLLSGGLRLPRPGQPRLSLRRRPPRPGQPRLGLRRRLPRLPRIGLSPLGAGLKPSPGLLSRRDLLFRRPAHPVQLRPSRLSRLPRPRRVLPGLAGPGLSPSRPGLRARYRLVPLPPHRSQLLPRGPRLLLSGGLRLPRPGQPRLSLRRRPPRPGQPRLGLRRHLPRLPRIGLSPLGAGLKPSPGLLSRRDLLFRRPAHPVQLRPSRLSRLPRPRRVLPGLAGPGLSPSRPGLRARYRLVPLPPHRSQLLPRGPRLLLSGGLRLPRPGQPRLSLRRRPPRPGQPRLGLRRHLPRLPRIGLSPLGAGLKPSPGLLSRRDLLFRRPAHPVQLRPSRLSRLPRPRRVLPGLAGPGLSPSRPGLRARYRLVPLPPHRSQLLPRGPRLLLSGGLRLPRIGLGPLGAGLKPSPGLLSRRHLLFRRPAHPVQLHLSRLSPGHPGLRARYRLVPLPPHRSQLLPRGPRLLLSGGLRLPRPGQPRLSLGCRSTRLPRISLGPLAAPPERGPRPSRVPRTG